MIDKASALMKLPEALEPTQRAWFEAIRYTGNIASISYARLQAVLAFVSKNINGPQELPPFEVAFGDAWALIDVTHRFGRLLQNPPFSVRKHGDLDNLRRAFRSYTLKVEVLRNAVQHLDREYKAIGARDDVVWGKLRWVSHVADNEFALATMASGKIPSSGNHQLENPMGRLFQPPTDMVYLEAHGEHVPLSEAYRQMVEIVRHIERTCEREFEGHPHSGGDVLLVVRLGPGDESSEVAPGI